VHLLEPKVMKVRDTFLWARAKIILIHGKIKGLYLFT